MTTKQIMNTLESKDWSFPDESSRGDITDLHPYPARFIPPIPENIICEFSNKKLNILDPFAGCGTTLRVGLGLGHNVFGIDVNGLASLLQRVYTSIYSDNDLLIFDNIANKIISTLRVKRHSNQIESTIPNINHWFDENAQQILLLSVHEINASKANERILDLLKFAVSRITVRISNQKSNTQYVAINKNQDRDRMISILSESFRLVSSRFKENVESQLWEGSSTVILGDARDTDSYADIKDIDLIVTSPPYPNAYEYWLYHKYRMFWLGLDPLWARSREIGARPFYSGTGKKDEFDFQNDLQQILHHLHGITKPDALQFWVIGNSIIKGRHIDNTKILTDACRVTGWQVTNTMQRIVNRNKSSFQGIGRQGVEHILVIEKA